MRDKSPAGVRPDIQGLRGLAVLAVVLYHASVPFTPGGFVGVDVFFVISGYLITGLLAREVDVSGRIAYGTFIARRARRLLPAALTLIAVVCVVSIHVYPPLERIDVLSAARAAALYVANIWFGARAVDYFGGTAALNPMLHMWSLAVEEQFYLVWPILLAFAVSTNRLVVRKRMLLIVSLVSIVSLVLCISVTRIAQPWAFFGTPFRAWEFGLGALVFLTAHRIGGLPGRTRSWMGIFGLLLIVASIALLTDATSFPGVLALVPAGGSALILASSGVPGPVRSLLTVRPMVRMGDVSYSWYLWHWPLIVMFPLLVPLEGPWVTVVAVLVSYAIAEFSCRIIEEPFRHGFAVRWRVGTVVSFAAAFTVGSAALVSLMKNAAAGGGLQGPERAYLAARNDISPVYGKGCHVDFLQVDPIACMAGDGKSDFTIVLLGDSHAAHWYPALEVLASQRGWTLMSMTKSGCPWVDVPVQLPQFRREYTECKAWRDGAIHKISTIKPQLVILANSYRDGVTISDWAAGSRRTAGALSATGARIVLIRDTPRPGFDVPSCLARARHVGRDPSHWCSFVLNAPSSAESQAFRAENSAMQSIDRSVVIDATAVICPKGRCTVIADNVVRFSDTSHLTATYSRQLAPVLGEQISNALDRLGQ